LFKKQISHALLFKNVVWVVYLADILWCACYQAIFVFHARLRKNGWKFEAKITFHYVIMFSVLRIFLKKKKNSCGTEQTMNFLRNKILKIGWSCMSWKKFKKF